MCRQAFPYILSTRGHDADDLTYHWPQIFLQLFQYFSFNAFQIRE